MDGDSYRTIEAPSSAIFKEKSSKFLAFAYPVCNAEQIKDCLDALRKKYYEATHHCYAWRMGAAGERTRANDDGEPSGTAGRPILGQLLSADVTDCLIAVVRYFGGTKLGVSGLIEAYRQSAADVLACARIVERTVDTTFDIEFPYQVQGEVMRVVKDMQPRVVSQQFDNMCSVSLSIRRSMAEQLRGRLEKIESMYIKNYI